MVLIIVGADPRVCPWLGKRIHSLFQNDFIDALKQALFPAEGEHMGSTLQKTAGIFRIIQIQKMCYYYASHKEKSSFQVF
ncbi:MAG: hypothetical protein CR974_02965 [Gammaproteobacteria bacterium]|nr:MAG: hypothetical protein CR974_02965 [Gammaproteobacteria bacterium]